MTQKPKFLTPNNLTFARLVMAAAVFAPMAFYNPVEHNASLLDLAAALFLIATLTDVVDGYIARRFQMQSSLGRLLDPFVDKVLVIGAFIFLAGANFHVGGKNLTSLTPWMIVLIISRELLVTSLRGVSEAQGVAFAATVYGKVKMFLQSACIIVILISVAHFRDVRWADIVRLVMVWTTVIYTVMSMIAYISRYIALSRLTREATGDRGR